MPCSGPVLGPAVVDMVNDVGTFSFLVACPLVYLSGLMRQGTGIGSSCSTVGIVTAWASWFALPLAVPPPVRGVLYYKEGEACDLSVASRL